MTESGRDRDGKHATTERQFAERITPRDKQAILREYVMRKAQGEARETILEDVAARLEKSATQVERYVHEARQAEDERILTLAQRLKGKVDRRQTAHERAMREMARRLGEQLTLPPSHDIFSVSRDNQYWFPQRLSWALGDDGKARLSLRLEQDEDTRILYLSLMEHLSASGFELVAPTIAQWKKRAADYLTACYAFVSHVTQEVEAVLGIEVALDTDDGPGVLPAFPLTVCFDAVDRATGTALSSGFEYRLERPAKAVTVLRFGAYTIAIARSRGEADRLQREHVDLRDKHAASRSAAALAAAAKEASGMENQVRDALRRFSLSTPLAGYCALCAPPAP